MKTLLTIALAVCAIPALSETIANPKFNIITIDGRPEMFVEKAFKITKDHTFVVQAPVNPSSFRYAFAYDVNLKETAPVAGSKIGSLPKFLGLNMEPEVWAFAGVTTRSMTPLAGFSAMLSYSLSTNSKMWFGVGVAVENAQPVGGVGLLGFEVKF